MTAWGFGLIGTWLIFLATRRVYRIAQSALLNPMVTSVAALSAILLFFHLPYSSWSTGAHWYTAMLGPATVAFAVPLYKHFATLKRHALEMSAALLAGSITAILSTIALARGLHLSNLMVDSLAPRSVTTPIAMAVSNRVGGSPDLTAIFVILTGVIGTLIGPKLVRLLRLKHGVAIGTLLGMGAHGIGTARAFEFSDLIGTISSLTMIIAGFVASIAIPIAVFLFNISPK
ncbi:LrgB family protein [Ferroacidibacillus organovorans]|uniref:CidB/LrgB family autolysis modulator n=1 Tax=Ferroacidibacillus organovorans TaxID=1765683 RepID=A0A161PXQ9_9BACL|nr:LrgB family protein [Ferroacidibacillus organovorans]KYP80655.1 hypothetical protein AYJ22_10470 [Ferroacidibacillus organovorans]OAG93501.1 hypothetical protein AYW79_10260 [Ferroacidibacillus organovorans]OPG17242.1 hypothetical protein B2M26_02635 [Ferroacidibacillus organovorans]